MGVAGFRDTTPTVPTYDTREGGPVTTDDGAHRLDRDNLLLQCRLEDVHDKQLAFLVRLAAPTTVVTLDDHDDGLVADVRDVRLRSISTVATVDDTHGTIGILQLDGVAHPNTRVLPVHGRVDDAGLLKGKTDGVVAVATRKCR